MERKAMEAAKKATQTEEFDKQFDELLNDSASLMNENESLLISLHGRLSGIIQNYPTTEEKSPEIDEPKTPEPKTFTDVLNLKLRFIVELNNKIRKSNCSLNYEIENISYFI